jgi:hypothetical protein
MLDAAQAESPVRCMQVPPLSLTFLTSCIALKPCGHNTANFPADERATKRNACHLMHETTVCIHTNSLSQAARTTRSTTFLPGDDRYAVVSHIDGAVYKLDVRMRRRVDAFLGHCNTFHAQLRPMLLDHGRMMAALGADCCLRIWNVARAGAFRLLFHGQVVRGCVRGAASGGRRRDSVCADDRWRSALLTTQADAWWSISCDPTRVAWHWIT